MRQVSRDDIEQAILNANTDNCFGDRLVFLAEGYV
jgi:hypothetical protein